MLSFPLPPLLLLLFLLIFLPSFVPVRPFFSLSLVPFPFIRFISFTSPFLSSFSLFLFHSFLLLLLNSIFGLVHLVLIPVSFPLFRLPSFTTPSLSSLALSPPRPLFSLFFIVLLLFLFLHHSFLFCSSPSAPFSLG